MRKINITFEIGDGIKSPEQLHELLCQAIHESGKDSRQAGAKLFQEVANISLCLFQETDAAADHEALTEGSMKTEVPE